MALAIIISAAITSGGAGLGFLSFIAACAIAFQAWQQIKTYPQRKRAHQRREIRDYPKKLEDYERKKRQHEQENRASQSPERASEFPYKRLRDVLSRTSRHDGDRSTSKTGALEARIGNYLNGIQIESRQG